MISSLDGYVTGADGTFDWAEPDAEVHSFVNDRDRGVGTYLYGRRMFETMRVWAEDDWLDGAPEHIADYAQLWRAADKVVYSRTLESVGLPRTRLERRVDPAAIRALRDSTDAELAVAGPPSPRSCCASAWSTRSPPTSSPWSSAAGSGCSPRSRSTSS